MKQKSKAATKKPFQDFRNFWDSHLAPLLLQKVGRHLIVVFILSYLLLTGTRTLTWFLEKDRYNYQEGDIAVEDIILSQELLFLDQEATSKKRDLRLATVNPQFVMQEDITLQVLNRFDEFREHLMLYLDSEDQKVIPPEVLDLVPSSLVRTLEASDNPREILQTTREMIVTIMYQGYFRLLSFDQVERDPDKLIEVITSGESQGFRTTMHLKEILVKDNVIPFIQQNLPEDLYPALREQIQALVLYFIEENCYYNQVLTEEQKDTVYNLVEPVFTTYKPGDTLIYQGAVLTSRDIQKLELLQEQLGAVTPSTFFLPLFFLGLVLFLGGSFLVLLGRKIYKPQNMILALYMIFFYIVYMQFLFQFSLFGRTTLQLVLIPAGFITLLLTQIMDRREDLLVYAVLMSLLTFFLSGGGETFLVYSLLSGIAGIMVLPRGEKRIDLLKAGARLGLVHCFILAAVTLFRGNIAIENIVDLILALVSGPVASLLVMSLLPLFEQFMNSCTAFRLTELSNLNDPIMKRMFIRAPGTYVHSINVAYMAEPACKSIGANSMLARVGGYYHDIGKIDQAEYYIENQKDGNKHDELKATLSAAIIKSHVRAGLEKARELKLPTEILDIIGQHHGTSVIRYFYERAIKDETGKSTVNMDDFCHSGPKPRTKEAAVVMLADTVEAATRTLRKPTRAKLEKYIWELIIDRFQNGELNDSGLTLKELEIIKDNFVHVLTGHFHSRVEYPESEEK